MDEHIIEALGKTKITINDGKITKIEEPEVEYCPLFHKHRGIEKLNKETIRENIEFRINDFGMCTPKRKLYLDDFLSFGISETISTLISEKIIDTSIIVCEGAGTVIIKDPRMVQGIGGRVSALIKTSPIKEIIEEIGENNILNPKTVEINQIEGLKKAISQGYKKIAVTVALSADVEEIRKIEKEYDDVEVYIFVVHTTKASIEDAKTFFKHADVITACASKNIRLIGEKESKLTAGQSVPIYAASEKGKYFLQKRIDKIGGLKDKPNSKIPNPLI